MTLKITLKPHERIIIGSAVITNGDQRCNLSIENRIPILRQKDILKEDKTNTLALKIYFVIQLMYIDEENLVKYHKTYWELIGKITQTIPNVLKFIDDISENILSGDYYHALKSAKKLINYEAEVLNREQ